MVEDDRPRLWANPGAKCVEKSPCSFACCAEGRYCEGQCCQDACGVDSKGKPCCKNSAEGQCSIGPHRPSQNLWIVAVLFGVPVFAVVLYALYYYLFAHRRSTAEQHQHGTHAAECMGGGVDHRIVANPIHFAFQCLAEFELYILRSPSPNVAALSNMPSESSRLPPVQSTIS